MLSIFALVVIVVLVAAGIAIVVKLGSLPGKLAQDRAHPQADAIRVLGWIGILTLGVGWLVAIVWAYCAPWPVRLTAGSDGGAGDESALAELRARVVALEEQLALAGSAKGHAS